MYFIILKKYFLLPNVYFFFNFKQIFMLNVVFFRSWKFKYRLFDFYTFCQIV